MNLPITLSSYLARQFAMFFIVILSGLLGIVYVGEALELLRRAAAHPNVTLGLVLQMAFLKLPGTEQVILPSVMLFAALYFFWRFTRSRELEVSRAAGLSVWNFLTPVALAALLIGVTEVTIISPLSAVMVARYERMEDKYFRGRPTTLEISSSGIWISQADGKGQAFIHALSLKPGTFELQQVMVIENPSDLAHSVRMDADSARLIPGAWELTNAYIHEAGQIANHAPLPLLRLPTDLTQERIEDSFASPNSLSFWQLPGFIRTLKAAGLSTTRHELYFQSLLAKPLLLAAMVLLAAVFGLRRTRQGGVFSTIVSGVVLGLLLYVLDDVIHTFAESGDMPILLGAWGPALVGLTGSAAALFHFEDG